jgi:hypothetical protein
LILLKKIRQYFPEKYCLKFSILIFLSLILNASISSADYSYLLYLEAQAVGGYSQGEAGPVLYSMNKDDAMQKPSVGFDYIGRFSGETGDYGVLAIQGRLAYDDASTRKIEPQLYNAYFKYKAGFADIWAGHNRISLGISSYLDNHAQLIPDLAMLGFGYDRDWGVGMSRDLEWGNFSISASTGSGMGLHTRDNYLFSTRVSKGILTQDNYNIGFSAAYGKILETMGYEVMLPDPIKFYAAGADLTYLWDNFENRLDIIAGKKMDKSFYALWWRFGINLYEEGRLKFEVQPVYWKIGGDKNFQGYCGISYQLTGDTALRTMYLYDGTFNNNRIMLQIYWYYKL